MESFQAIATSIGVIGLILLVLLLVLHLFGPKTAAWIYSNREEKIGFSKSKLYHANGYLIHSGSDLLLNSTGSFKRFDSIDRDYKPIDQTSLQSPSWTITVPEIPPQPLRPAPKSPTFRDLSQETSTELQLQRRLQTLNEVNNKSNVIPRPITKRQHSSPANCGVARINLSEAVAKITNGPRSCTNPFLNGSMSISEDSNSNDTMDNRTAIEHGGNENEVVIEIEKNRERFQQTLSEKWTLKNPFSSQRRNEEKTFFSFPINGNGNDKKMDTVPTTNESIFQLNDVSSTILQTNNEQQIQQGQQQQFHIRKFSDVGIDNCNLVQSMPIKDDHQHENIVVNPFISGNGHGHLHKTLSDTYLEQFAQQNNKNQTPTPSPFSRTSSRQSITNTSATGSTTSMNSSDTDLKRAVSCESMNSESSVLMADLEQQESLIPIISGQLCVGLQYDKCTMTDEGIELVITVMEAKDLIGPRNVVELDTFVRIFLIPDDQPPLQTKVFRNSKCPTYNETLSFWLNHETRTKRTLWFHLYHSGNVHTLMGESVFEVGDVRRPITTWLTLSDSRLKNSPYGELMFSLSYLPTAERLKVVVVKARNLKLSENAQNNSLQSVFVKVYLLKDDKKVSKKRTSAKRPESNPIYNESMIFSVPPYMLNSIQIRLTVVGVGDSINESTTGNITSYSSSNSSATTIEKPIGHVIVGCGTTDNGQRHWSQMLTSLRKPVAMWHIVRQTMNSTSDNGVTSETQL